MESLYASVSGFVSRRRRPLTVLAGVAGGAYLVASYARSKLEDIQEGLGRKRANRENLRRRFQQNQEDCGFTVLALLPTLGTQILEAMDVEALTARLSSLGKAKTKPPEAVAPEPEAAAAPINGEQTQLPGTTEAEGTVAAKESASLLQATSLPNGGSSQAETADVPAASKSALDPHAPSFTPGGPSALPEAAVHAPEDTQSAPNGITVEETVPSDPSLLPSIPSAFDLSQHLQAPSDGSKPTTNGLEASTASLATPHASAFLPAKPVNGFEALAVPPPVTLDASLSEPPPPASPSATSLPKSKLDGMTKAEIWNELKILAFSRLLTSIYCLALLTLQTHVQLNLLGRYAYVSSVFAMAENEDHPSYSELPTFARRPEDDEATKSVDLRTERRYLTFSWWLLHRGWEEVALRVREKVEEVLGPTGLKETVGVKELKKIFGEVRRKVETEDDGTPFSFAAALFPPTTISELETLRAGGMPPLDCVVDPPLRSLLDETADFIDAPDFTQVLGAGVERVLSLVLEKVSESAGLGPLEDAPPAAAEGDQPAFIHPRLRFQELADDGREKKVRLANLLPVISRQAHTVLNGLPNECAEALEDTREILEYSSVVYTSYES